MSWQLMTPAARRCCAGSGRDGRRGSRLPIRATPDRRGLRRRRPARGSRPAPSRLGRGGAARPVGPRPALADHAERTDSDQLVAPHRTRRSQADCEHLEGTDRSSAGAVSPALDDEQLTRAFQVVSKPRAGTDLARTVQVLVETAMDLYRRSPQTTGRRARSMTPAHPRDLRCVLTGPPARPLAPASAPMPPRSAPRPSPAGTILLPTPLPLTLNHDPSHLTPHPLQLSDLSRHHSIPSPPPPLSDSHTDLHRGAVTPTRRTVGAGRQARHGPPDRPGPPGDAVLNARSCTRQRGSGARSRHRPHTGFRQRGLTEGGTRGTLVP
jgi:hypothetical protein